MVAKAKLIFYIFFLYSLLFIIHKKDFVFQGFLSSLALYFSQENL